MGMSTGLVTSLVLRSAAAALVLLPKLLLVEYAARRLRPRPRRFTTVLLFVPDLSLAAFLLGLFLVLDPGVSPVACAVAGVAEGALLFFLLADARVRQLWQSPIDLELLAYTFAWGSDVSSGRRIFFGWEGGLRLPFGVHLALSEGLLVASWSAIAAAGPIAGDISPLARAMPILLAGFLAALARYGPRNAHRLEAHLLLTPVLRSLGRRPPTPGPSRSAPTLACPLRPCGAAISAGRSLLPADFRPFKNVVLVLLEGVRFSGTGIDGDGATALPFLRQLAREGALFRARSCVPHTSKACFAVLTGRHPPPGILMEESRRPRHESWPWAFREEKGARTICLSSQHLGFEGTDSLLRALGFAECHETRTLLGSGTPPAGATSFGSPDECLLGVPLERLAAGTRPFAAFLVMLAAHYPYRVPGEPAKDDGIDAYWRAVTHADAVLERLVARLGASGLLEDTLVVAFGDHGESFGEHGTFVHNNSLFEEEVATPLVFWSVHGRLAHDGVLPGRQIDIAPTIADLTGLRRATFPAAGASLFREVVPSPVFLASFFDGVARGVVSGETKYVCLPPSGELFAFDLAADPGERHPRPVRDPEVRRGIGASLARFEEERRLVLAE